MNELVTRQTETEPAISLGTKGLRHASIAKSPIIRYQRLSKQIETWLDDQMLTTERIQR